MSMEIYWISGSAPAWRVIMMAEYKQLDYQSIVLETSKKQQKEPWFLNLNPRGQIPLLIHDDVVVTESLAIMHYFENAFSSIPLFGKTPSETASIEQSIFEVLSYVDKPVADFVQPVFRNKINSFRDALDGVAAKILKELGLLESKLSKGHWLQGDFSAADIVLTPTMQRLYRGIEQAPELSKEIGLNKLSEDFPALYDWRCRVEKLPAFIASFPPHWS